MNISTDVQIDMSVLTHEPANVYHANSAHYLGSHGLGDFRRCPLLHHKDSLGLIPEYDLILPSVAMSIFAHARRHRPCRFPP